MDQLQGTPPQKLKVAWISYFPVEWIPGFPDEFTSLPRLHPGTWLRVGWQELKDRPEVELHIFAVRSTFRRTRIFKHDRTMFYCLKTPPTLRTSTLYWLDTLLIRRELKRIQPDIVHAWGSEFGAISIATRLPYPALMTMQGIFSWLGDNVPLNSHLKVSRFLEKRALRKGRMATAESKFAIDYLGQRYPNLKLMQVEHAPDPIFSHLRRNPSSRLKFVGIGGFNYGKGADIIMKALDRLPPDSDYELVWIGGMDEEFAKKLQSETSPRVWNRLKHLKALTSAEVADELRTATLLLHASRADNSPNTVKEAVVAGVPVVATRTGGIPDYVFPDTNGFMFEAGNVEECALRIQDALSHPLFSKGNVDAECLVTVRRYLSAEVMADKFLDAYHQAIAIYHGR